MLNPLLTIVASLPSNFAEKSNQITRREQKHNLMNKETKRTNIQCLFFLTKYYKNNKINRQQNKEFDSPNAATIPALIALPLLPWLRQRLNNVVAAYLFSLGYSCLRSTKSGNKRKRNIEAKKHDQCTMQKQYGYN